MVEMISLILSITAWKLVKKGCITYLVVVKDLNKQNLKFENVPIVKKFLVVFSEELIELPPTRKIEFITDLMPRAEPISIPPYHMIPTKLRDLKV